MRIFTDIAEAERTILRRIPATEPSLPPHVQEGIRRVFGRDLTAAGVAEEICTAVAARGDAAVRDYTARIDGVHIVESEVASSDFNAALGRIAPPLREALERAAERIRAFHRHEHHEGWQWITPEGMRGQIVRPLARVGIYVPGGTAAYPSTLLMSAIPARVAGVHDIIVATPPHPAGVADVILAAAAIAGVDRVFTIGGAQAIAALAYGTETVPRVDKIVGPGNSFVSAAKRYVFGAVAIDQIAGPTETVVIADESADPARVAADLIAQAEHGETSSAILIATDDRIARAVDEEMTRQLADLPRAEIVRAALDANGGAVIVPSVEQAIVLANDYAPEHLCLLVREPWQYVGLVENAGGLFLGEASPEVLGDYIAGPSHVMPTGGSARFSSAMHVGDFVRTMSVVGLTPSAASALAGDAAVIASAEGLEGHARAARMRTHANTIAGHS
ncbi:MAG: histidinol dehydrogenase [Chloroflexota bacterium]|nr:histidinol dehydrogenase [Chloroflexota bacterium]